MSINVLIVEEDEGVRETISILLNNFGCNSFLLSSPKKAMKLLSAHRPSVIISGNKFNYDITGLEFGAEVKKMGIPFILMSGIPETVGKAKEKGFFAIEKPFQVEAIVSTVNLAIGAA